MRSVIARSRLSEHLFLILLAVVAAPSIAAPVTTELIAGASHASVIDVVAAMGARYLRTSIEEDREYFGAVLADAAGRFWATSGRGGSGANAFSMKVRLRAGYHIVAFWHTHGRPGHARDRFSDNDAELVRQHAAPLYLVTPRGQIRVLTPLHMAEAPRRAARSTVRLPRGAHAGVLVGRIDTTAQST